MKRVLLFVSIGISVFSTSCNTSKQIVYFENVKDTVFYTSQGETNFTIKPNDILSITISSANEEASMAFNPHLKNNIRSTTATGSSSEPGGYLVDSEGTISLPFLGKIKISGLTKEQAKDNITNLILSKKLLVDPLVEVRYLNYEVTVLGEVARPTVITVPSEKISLLKAIGLAGDMTIYGLRENVLLVREEGNKKVTRHINLNSRDFFQSPYYYLQPNDVVYVAPNKVRMNQATNNPNILPIILSSLSLAVIVIDRLLRPY
jgi:polysaccharide export outer membrane protein